MDIDACLRRVNCGATGERDARVKRAHVLTEVKKMCPKSFLEKEKTIKENPLIVVSGSNKFLSLCHIDRGS